MFREIAHYGDGLRIHSSVATNIQRLPEASGRAGGLARLLVVQNTEQPITSIMIIAKAVILVSVINILTLTLGQKNVPFQYSNSQGCVSRV